MTSGILASIAASFAAALIATWVVMSFAPRLGIMDKPNSRSSHSRPIPRGGGIGVIVGAAFGIAALAIAGERPGNRLAILLLGATSIALVGAVDDVRTLPASLRLLLQLLIATAISIALGGITRLPLPSPLDLSTGVLAWPLGALWLTTVANFYNFMDGIDGLAAGQAIASSIGVAIAAWATDATNFAFVLAAAALGFLVLNRPPARIFLGDVGSTSIGFTLAGLAMVAGVTMRPAAVLAIALGLALFLLDPIETLTRLARRGHRIGSAHRLHDYQILAQAYRSHARITGALLLAGLILSVAGAFAFRFPGLRWPVLVLAVALFAVERYAATRQARAQDAFSAT